MIDLYWGWPEFIAVVLGLFIHLMRVFSKTPTLTAGNYWRKRWAKSLGNVATGLAGVLFAPDLCAFIAGLAGNARLPAPPAFLVMLAWGYLGAELLDAVGSRVMTRANPAL